MLLLITGQAVNSQNAIQSGKIRAKQAREALMWLIQYAHIETDDEVLEKMN